MRELEALRPLELSLVSERRRRAPFGLAGGHPGARGRNLLNNRELGSRARVTLAPGDRIRVETPGGGGYATPPPLRPDPCPAPAEPRTSSRLGRGHG